ncbi:MAG TPA: SMC-Scp complex subunit ScpB [Polyangia bacterium]|jgi:segregation and condensation protein B|nr:SMC-Scp complex subunit ScpB [Polyangia bacterium]HWE26930.1 SMC-Scp complex subunit ScpB [Polyangia bacterium]
MSESGPPPKEAEDAAPHATEEPAATLSETNDSESHAEAAGDELLNPGASEAATDEAARAVDEAAGDEAEAAGDELLGGHTVGDESADAPESRESPDSIESMGHGHEGSNGVAVGPADVDRAGLSDEPVPAEATEDHPEEVPPDPGSADAASPRMQSIVESLLFAADKALTLKQLADLLGESEVARVRAAVAAVEVTFATRGFQLHQVAGGYQFRTNPDNAQWVQKLLAQKPVKLSRAQIETLAIAAYRQPVTRPEIDEIRGVDSGGTLKTLLDRSLVRILGKKEEVGRPLLYGTTKEFLEFFNLGDLKQLPTLREFHELSEEHQAQVAALEGVAPPGVIEGKDGDAPLDAGPPPLTRLEITIPVEDEQELEEIDRLIRTAGVATDADEPAAEPEAAAADEFEHEPTREFDAMPADEPTRVHANTLQVPEELAELEHVDEEFDHSETTSKKKRPEGVLDVEDHDHDAESQDGDEPSEEEPEL